jgi:hypothetical protein
MIGSIIMLAIPVVCLVSAFLAFGALADILINGRGFGCVLREKSREATVFLASVSSVSVCLAFGAISDIRKDYAGTMLYLPDGSSVQSVLPYWVKCELEWSIVGWAGLTLIVSQLSMLALHVRREKPVKQFVAASPRWKEDIGFPQ